MEWKILRARRGGVRLRLAVVARNVARSRAFHSHSRFDNISKGDGNVSVLSVVSIWKILTPASRITWPIRQFDECSSERSWSMNERECCIVWTLWWWRRLRYEARPVAVDFHPPSMATRLML